MDDVRTALDTLIRDRDEDYASLSRFIGRNAAYIQQFIRRGVPRKLDEADRRKLARYFRVDESVLGGPAPIPVAANDGALTIVPRFAVGASAGAGSTPGDERAESAFALSTRYLREMTANPGADRHHRSRHLVGAPRSLMRVSAGRAARSAARSRRPGPRRSPAPAKVARG